MPARLVAPAPSRGKWRDPQIDQFRLKSGDNVLE
jgi:hypothetical protein